MWKTGKMIKIQNYIGILAGFYQTSTVILLEIKEIQKMDRKRIVN